MRARGSPWKELREGTGFLAVMYEIAQGSAHGGGQRAHQVDGGSDAETSIGEQSVKIGGTLLLPDGRSADAEAWSEPTPERC